MIKQHSLLGYPASLANLRFANSATETARINGLVARSKAMLVGTVGSPRSRIAVTIAMRSTKAAFSGSTLNAKRPFERVYSCAQ